MADNLHWEYLGTSPGGVPLKVCTKHPHSFGIDPFLLAAFSQARPESSAADLGAGCGILSVLLYKMYLCKNIYSLEIQSDAFALLQATISASSLHQIILPVQGDLRSLPPELPRRSLDLVVCNPPYFRQNPSPDPQRAAAREEVLCTLQEVCEAAAALLRPKGRLCLCLRPERLPELFAAMTRMGFEPKRLRLAADSPSAKPWLALVEGRLQGKPSLRTEPLFFAKNPDGTPSQEMTKLFQSGNV